MTGGEWVRFWEGRPLPGGLADLLGWVRGELLPRALATPGCRHAEVLVSDGPAEPRILLLTRWSRPPSGPAPGHPKLAGSHEWDFRAV